MNPSVIGADVDASFALFSRRIADLALASDANKARVQQLGGVELLVNLVGKGQEENLLQASAFALSNIALSPSGRDSLLQSNAVEPLVALVGMKVGEAPQAAAAGALRNIACGADGRALIVQLGGVEKLVGLCAEDKGTSVQENAAAALANLADDPSCRERVASCGGLELLVELCNSSPSDAVLACAAAALGNLADDDQNRIKIAEIGGLEPLVRSCASSVDDSVLESSAAALANLAYNENNRKRIAQISGIEPLVWLCAHSKNDAVLESAAAALGNLAYYNDLNRMKVAETGGLLALVTLCETNANEAVLESVSGALRHVVYNNDSNRIKFVKMGGLELLTRLCANCENEVVLESATAMLRKLVATAEVAHKLIGAGILPALLKLEVEWTGTVRSYSTQVLRSLEKHSRRTWIAPSGNTNAPTMAYMLLPCAHPASMSPDIRKQIVQRQQSSVANGTGADDKEAVNKEMDGVHQDLESLEGFLQSRSGTSIEADRCIESRDAFIVLQNAGPQKAIKEFFLSDEIDLFVLAYSGHATSEGGWCFAEHIMTFEQQARAKTSNTEARLLIIIDAPFAGLWADALSEVPAAAAFASGIMVQAACGSKQQALSEPGTGGVFTKWYTKEESHGQSVWSVSEPKPVGTLNGEQVPSMTCKFDVFSSRRSIMCVGGEENIPNISVYGNTWFTE